MRSSGQEKSSGLEKEIKVPVAFNPIIWVTVSLPFRRNRPHPFIIEAFGFWPNT
jgi:hypothetical protein